MMVAANIHVVDQHGNRKTAFDQSVDILNTIGGVSNAARDMVDGLIDRINDVRGKHGQPTYVSSFGSQEKEFKAHSNATRRYQEELQRYKALGTQDENLKAPQDPWAEPPKPRNVLPFNENATMMDYEKYKDSYESLNAFTGASGDFVTIPKNFGLSKFAWKSYKDTAMTKELARQAIAGALAAKDTPLLYSKAWNNQVGCDGSVFQVNYNKYMEDTAVEKLASQMEDPEARKKYFGQKEVDFENLDINLLQADYQKLAEPALEL